MQVDHVLFFKLKEHTPAKFQELHSSAMKLKNIPGVLDVTFGPSFTLDRTKGYTHGFRVRMLDEASLKAYGPHPIHQEFVKVLGEVREDTPICLDWLVPAVNPEAKI